MHAPEGGPEGAPEGDPERAFATVVVLHRHRIDHRPNLTFLYSPSAAEMDKKLDRLKELEMDLNV